MATRLNDKTEYAALLSVLLRHQIFVDRLKLGIASNFGKVLRALYEEFSKFIVQSRYASMDQFTKTQLETFVYRFKVVQANSFDAYTQEIIDLLKRMLRQDTAFADAIFAPFASEDTQSSEKDITRLWNEAATEPIPANGLLLPAYLASFSAYATGAVIALLRQGYANGWTMPETLNRIVGSKEARLNDGLFGKLAGQNQSLVDVLVQHTSSLALADVASKTFQKYVWVSVIDNRTTEVCLSRAGNVYVFGEGPLPPAHYRCRSTILPIVDESVVPAIPKSYTDWFSTQPSKFRSDGSGPLTLDQFSTKLNLILEAA